MHAVIPRGKGQSPVETVDGVRIHSFPLSRYHSVGAILKDINANVFHSQDPTLGTAIALRTRPDAKHMMTCQNPKTREDWSKVNEFYPLRRRLYNRVLDPLVLREVRRLDGVYCQCNHIREKARSLYKLDYLPEVLPNPVRVRDAPTKSVYPQVCFLGRLDKEKNPERFFELSKEHPDIRFIAAGRAHDEKRDRALRRHESVNLELVGHIEGSAKSNLLDSSWILVNTSVSECLPVAFLEAAAAGCAILSPHDPDGFASSFGYRVNDDYDTGFEWLFNCEMWRIKGKAGREYIKKTHEYNRVIDKHVEEYERLLG